jgi:hypothetical protein
MHFGDRGIAPPSGFETDGLLVRPITAADAELDYDAVMESREFLRLWSQSTWPADDFTVEDNRADMVKMEDRHKRHEAFGYAVMNPEQTECLGCIYIFPPDANWFSGADVTAINIDHWSDCDALLLFWVRVSRIADGLDRRLLEALLDWFEQEWSFDAPVVVTNEQFEQQVTMIEGMKLHRRFEIDLPDDPARYLAYA